MSSQEIGIGIVMLLVMVGIMYLIGKRRLEEVSNEDAANRDIVARAIERGDYLHMEEKAFRQWAKAHAAKIFPHELEAMERARKAKLDRKP